MFSPKKILAIKFRAMGDTVLMTAPLAELKNAFPGAEIHAAVSGAWAPILENLKAVSRIYPYERRKDAASRAKAIARLALQLRKEKFDCVVNFHASPSSAALAYATGAKTRSIHFHGHHHRNRYSTVEVPGKGVLKPIIERDMDAIRALGVEIPSGRMPKLNLRAWEAAEASERAHHLGLHSPLLGLGLGASRPSKSWPVERFAALAVRWCRKTKGSTIALAGPNEQELVSQFLKIVDDTLTTEITDISERSGVRARLVCETGLAIRRSAALVARAAVFVGNDSGLRHVATALEVPTVTLFGPEDPFEWHPYSRDLHPIFFMEGLACRKDADVGKPDWCSITECVEEEHRCMRQIGIDPVLETSLRIARH